MRIYLPLAVAALSSFVLAGCSGTADDASAPDDTGTQDLSSSGNAKTAFKFFVDKGLSEMQSAAIVGNLQQESNVIPTKIQPGGAGRGIAQWSSGDRWNVKKDDNVKWYADQQGASMNSLNLQLEFIWYELDTFPHYGLASLRDASSISTAVTVFMKDFEICGKCDPSNRVKYAKSALAAYGSGN